MLLDRTLYASRWRFMLLMLRFKDKSIVLWLVLEKNVTFDGEEARFEVNIFDFNQDIYGETVMVYWLDRIRDMTKFAQLTN